MYVPVGVAVELGCGNVVGLQRVNALTPPSTHSENEEAVAWSVEVGVLAWV